MASATLSKERIQYGEFNVQVSQRNPGMNLPQRMGRRLWLPMLLMGLMALPALLVLGIVRGALISDGDEPTAVAILGHIIPGVEGLMFMGIFSGIVFAIARILGAFREGGGGIQESAGKRVLTLVMPHTAWAMLMLMMMGMMMLMFAVVAEFVLAAVAGDAMSNVAANIDHGDLRTVAAWGTWMEGVRRLAISIYLLSIGLGLATIVTVIRLQSRRIRELAQEA